MAPPALYLHVGLMKSGTTSIGACRHGARSGPLLARPGRGGILDRWSRLVPAERISVVTVPHAGAARDRLIERFCSVIDLDPRLLTTEPRRANDSLGRTQVEVLRRINRELPAALRLREAYGRAVKRPFAFAHVATQPAEMIGLPQEYADWAGEQSQATIDAITERGYRVVGTLGLDDLRPDPSAFTDGFTPVDEAAVAASTVEALAAFLAASDARRRADGAGRRGPTGKTRPAGREWAAAQTTPVNGPSRGRGGRVRSLIVRAARRFRSPT